MLATLATIPMILAAENGGLDPLVWKGLLVLMVTLALASISMQRRRKTREPSMQDYSRDQAARARQQKGVRDDMEEIVVQISELARHLNAQMDTRFVKLEQVIAEADAKIATLEGLLRQAAGVKGVDVVVDDKTAGEPTAEPVANGANESRKRGKKAARADKAAAKRDDSAASSLDAPAKDQTPADPDTLRYGRIYALADQGVTTVEIARQVGQTTGEIELILNLRKSRSR